jgi:hypothetical protein
MAERRMFAKTIIDSDAFLDMPVTARLLYYDLAMRADDDGFVNSPKKIMRMIGASQDDLTVLALKKFIIPFDNGIVVIKHWRIHNYIRKDTYTETPYTEQKNLLALDENRAYTLNINEVSTDWQRAVDEPSTQVRLGKDSLVKVSIGEGSKEDITADEPPTTPHPRIDFLAIQNLYNTYCPSLPRCSALSDARKKAIKARFTSGYTEEDFKTLFIKAEASGFLKGRNNRDWKANFDWLIKDANFAKVLDGNYDEQSNAGGNGYQSQSSNIFLDMLNERGGTP